MPGMMNDQFNAMITTIPMTELIRSAQAISQRYRALEKPYLRSYNDYLAYLAVRLPGTLAAIIDVLKRVPTHIPIQSFLDLGAGPGTGWLAATQCFPMLTTGTLIETDQQFIDLGQHLVADRVTWACQTLPCPLSPHDVVLMSYSLGEMPNPDRIVIDAWRATQQTLVLIEPGTPKGYQLIIQMRDILLSAGAYMIAPCPNAGSCPMHTGDWCHFPARVERSKIHMQLKAGTLGYEDEKYAYLIVSKEPIPLPRGRIIAPPIIHKGHIELSVCTQGSIKQEIFSKKQGELYKRNKKLRWGDGLS